MVDLPEVPRRQVTSEAPRNRITAEAVGQSSRVFGGALQSIGADISAIAKDMQDAADTTAVARHLDAAKTQALDLSVKANGDAGLFEKSWASYTKTALKGIPKARRGEVEAKLIGMGGETYRGIFAQAADRTGKVALDAIDARIGTITGEMSDLARTGQSASDDFKSRGAELDGLISQKETNRLIAYSPESAAADRDKFEEQFIGAAITGELETIYGQQGLGAAQKRAQEILDDAGDGMTRIKKLKAIGEGLKSVRALYAADAEGKKQFRADVDTIVAAWGDGSLDPDSPLGTDLIATADEFRDPVTKLRIISGREKARLNPLPSMPLGDQLDYLGRMRGAESGGDPNADNPNSTALGADQFIESTWLDVLKRNRPDLAAGKSDAELLALRKDADLSGEMALKLADENNAALTGAGVPVTPENTYLAHFLGAGGAVNVLTASPETPVSSLLTPDAIAANKSVLDGKTAGEVRAWAGRKMGSPLDGYVKGVAPEVKKVIGAGLNDAIAHAGAMLDADSPLAADQITDMIDAARIMNDAGTTEKVKELIVRNGAVQKVADRSTAFFSRPFVVPQYDAQGFIDQLSAPGPVGDEALRISALKQATDTRDRLAKTLKEDPHAYGVQVGLIKDRAPITAATATPEALAASAKQMHTVAGVENTRPLPVLRPSEAKDLGAAIQSGDAAPVLSSLLTLGTDDLMATVAMPEIKDAVAGIARSTDPKKFGDAMTFLDTVWARSPMEAERMFGADTINDLQDWQATLRYSTPEELQKAIVQRSDPQFRDRRKKGEDEGRTLARKETVDSLIGNFDPWGFGNAAGAPVDAITRDTFLGDYEALFSQRFAGTLDAGTAKEQAISRMKNSWGRSDVNGGRLTLYPPELTYKSIGGAHDWMKTQFEADIQTRLGFVPETYTFIADRKTEGEIDAGEPASYLVAAVDPNTGETVMVNDPSRADGMLRYRWDENQAVEDSRATFTEKRKEGPAPDLTGPAPTRQPFDWMQGY